MPPLSSTAYETPDTTAYKTPEWAAAAVAEGRDPADVGSSNLALKIINGITSLAAAAALTFTPVGAQAQGMISKEAFGKCEAELMANYADKITKALADGKPHLVPVYERRRGEAITNFCTLVADNAALDQKIAANRSDIAAADQRIAAADQRIAAGKAEIIVAVELKNLFDKVKKIADRITAWSNNPADFSELNSVYASLLERQNSPGVSEVLPLVVNLIAKWGQQKRV